MGKSVKIKIYKIVHKIVVASFTEIKTAYRGFETKQNPVFRMLVLCMENYSQELVSGIASVFMVNYLSIFPTDDRPIIDFYTPLS